MIPTALLFGLVLGRWWAVPAGAVLWPVLVMVSGGDLSGPGDVAAAAALGAANAAVGVLAHKVLRRLWRLLASSLGLA